MSVNRPASLVRYAVVEHGAAESAAPPAAVLPVAQDDIVNGH
jgi:hypothetical protein